MRLSEKTIELNLCAQIRAAMASNLFWFGLTQSQEARAGFDACTRTGGKLLMLQFKASNYNVGGARRFVCDHDQLVALRARVRSIQRSVFYVFPLVGNTQELQTQKGDLLSTTWLLDVASLASLPAPTTSMGTIRKSGVHYVDVVPGVAVIHSDPIKAPLINAREFVQKRMPGRDGIERTIGKLDFLELAKLFSGRAAGAVEF